MDGGSQFTECSCQPCVGGWLQGQGLAGSSCRTGNLTGRPVEEERGGGSDEGDADGDAGGLGPLR